MLAWCAAAVASVAILSLPLVAFGATTSVSIKDFAFQPGTIAVHAGEIHYDSHGPYGEDVDIACRLVDAPELKRRLRETSEPLALVVSQEIHRSVVRHGYDGIDHSAFTQVVHIRVGAQRLRGWIHTPAAGQSGDGLTA